MPKLLARSRMPRPDDPTILQAVYDAVVEGQPLTTAATWAGISYATIMQWREVGALHLQQGVESAHVEFVQTILNAEAEFVRSRVRRINRAGRKGAWQADMTMLERRRPLEFGRFQRVEIAPASGPLELSAQDLARLQALAQKQLPAPVPVETAGAPA